MTAVLEHRASEKNALPQALLRLISAREICLIVILGLLAGFSLSIGRSFYGVMGMISFKDAWMWERGLIYGIASIVLLLVLVMAWHVYQDKNVERSSSLLSCVSSVPLYRRVLVLAACIILLWCPAFLAFYPGNYSSDGPIQVTYFLNDGIVDLHWPAAHTLLLTGIMQLGNALFGSYNAGVSLFCALQAIALAFALSYAANKALSWSVPVWLVLVSNTFIVLNPVVQAYAVTTAKDSLFAVFFVLTMVSIIDIIRDESCLAHPAFVVQLTLCAFGMCLMRKQGVYVLALVIVVMLFFISSWKRRACAVLMIVAVFVLSSAFSAMVSAIFTVRADSAREILSVPSQQIVRTYMYNYDSLSEEQIKNIGTYYDLQALEAGRTTSKPWETTPIGQFYDTEKNTGYLAPISDPAKAALIDSSFQNDPVGYLRMYFSIMRGHEGEYARAFLWGDIGYMYPTSAAANRWTGLSPWNEFNLTIKSAGDANQVSNYNMTTKLSSYLQWLYDGTWSMFANRPLLTWWVSPALPFFVLLLSFVMLATRRKGRLLTVAWLFPFIYWGSLALAPVMCIRYVVPLFFVIPLMMCIPFIQEFRVDAMETNE